MNRPAAWSLAVGGVALALALALADHRDGGEPAVWPRHLLRDIQPEQGLAFVAPLPPGAPSAHAGPVQAALFEDGAPIGSESEHDTIRQQGRGRFSFWRGSLRFAASDDSDPRRNGRRYEAAWPSAFAAGAERTARWLAWLGLGAGAALLLARPLRRLAAGRGRLLAKVALVPVSLLPVLGGAELVLRWQYPFVDNTWPGRFDPQLGFVFAPGGVVRQTNLSEFCVEQTANSLGFLDREPPPADPAVPRVVVLGDSFVEAVQVPIAGKFHVLLEQRLRARGVAARTVAFGMSGCGTSNVLPFYERFGRARPGDLVVLLVVYNDFANNSAWLEAVRHGWHPHHAPRQFFGGDGPDFVRLPIDPDWRAHLLPGHAAATAAPPPPWRSWSRLDRWVRARVEAVTGQQAAGHAAAQAERLAALKALLPEAAARFGDWDPRVDDLDTMTQALDPPPVFREAVALTEHALRVLRDTVQADGGRLLVVGCHHLADPPRRATRPGQPQAWWSLLQPMCERLALPLLDLPAAFRAAGALDVAAFPRDRHWNARGHAEAAIALDAWLQQHPEWLQRPAQPR